MAGLTWAPVEGVTLPAQLDLNLSLFTGGDGAGWTGAVVGAADMFDAATLESMASRYVALLAALTADPAAVLKMPSSSRNRLRLA